MHPHVGCYPGNPARRQSVSDALDSVSVLKSMEFPEQCVMWDSSINLRHIQDIIAEHFRQYPEEGHDWDHVEYEKFCSDIDSGGYCAPILPTGVSNIDFCVLEEYSHLWYHSGIWICHNFTAPLLSVRCCATVYLAPLDEQCYATALWIVLCHQHI